MKRILSIISACAAVVLAASCQEEIKQTEPQYQDVTFAVNMTAPEVTKALGNGSLAILLDMAVYHEGKHISSIVLPGVGREGMNATVVGTPGEWAVTLTLAKNVEYDIVFWAHAEGAPYTFDKAEHKIVVDYNGDANDEKRDAFYNIVKGYTVTDVPVDVELTRPFAQINFGASDYDPYITDFGFAMTSTIKCKAPSVLDVLTGEASEEVDVEFTPTAIPYETGDQVLTQKAGVTYHWMSMNYILASEYNSNFYGSIEATFNYNGKDLVVSVPSVPYARNYKTNIIGTLFTGPAKFHVVVVPGFVDTLEKEISNNL